MMSRHTSPLLHTLHLTTLLCEIQILLTEYAVAGPRNACLTFPTRVEVKVMIMMSWRLTMHDQIIAGSL